MSKAAKQSILILIVLLAGSLLFAGVTLMGKQKIEDEKAVVERNLQESRGQLQQQSAEIGGLKSQVQNAEGEKNKFKKMTDDMQKRVEDLVSQVSVIAGDRDKWQRRLEDIKGERDNLLAKLQEQPKRMQELKNEVEALTKEVKQWKDRVNSIEEERNNLAARLQSQQEPAGIPEPAPVVQMADEGFREVLQVKAAQPVDEEYTAQLLREKAGLELKIDELNRNLSKHSLEIIELRQTNETLQVELDTIKQAKKTIEEEIAHKEDLANKLSLELARAKNEKKFVSEKSAELNKRNSELLQQVKRLTSAKGALEKSIVRLTDEKEEAQKKLGQTESLVQSKIDEIWDIKESLDRSFRAAQTTPAAGEVELPPIVVSAQGEAPAKKFNSGTTKPGFEGKIVSINTENNFVIVDVGQKRGIRAGDTLGVYRGQEYIARLEVIQVREDISAADLKDQWAKVKVGDVVR